MIQHQEVDIPLSTFPVEDQDFKMKISTSPIRQFLILLYKGLLLRKRHYIVTFFEIGVPILIASIPVIITSELSNSNQSRDYIQKPGWENATMYRPFDPFVSNYYSRYTDVHFVYTPSNTYTDKLVDDSIRTWKISNDAKGNITKHSTRNEKELERYCTNIRQTSRSIILIGTVFESLDEKENVAPSSLNYKIRYGGSYGSNSFNTHLKYQVNGPHRYSDYTDTYFLSWQAAVEKEFIQQKVAAKENFSYKLMMQQFPYPPYLKTDRSMSVISLIPLIVGYGFFIFIINLMRRVIEEKANGSKELLKMMGMTDFLYWTSTFVNYFAVAALAVLIIAIMYKCPLKNSVIYVEHSNFFLLFLLLLLFMLNMILFCMALSTFFTRAVFGIIALVIIYNISLSLLSSYYFMVDLSTNYFPLPLIAKLGICLLPCGALLTMFALVAFYESIGDGVQWYNITDYSASPDLNLLIVIGAVLFSCFLYSIILWYVDAVWPWQYGVPKPFYFPFTKNYWCNYPMNEGEDVNLMTSDDDKNVDFFEVEPSGVSPGVVVRNLSKVFRTGLQTKLAVNNVSMNIYNGQITALLGHNGAGKTTTINILTGLYTPSSGSATINGWDIMTQTNKARQNLGVCPQHNVLYDTLTVEEHLKIYAGLKGVKWSNLTEEASNVLKTVKLLDKRNELTKNLSGGMKRKLSLGIAIVGGSKVLFLDEPTSGMDVEARRSVWDSLLEIRHDRTIVLTTHYMEEADVLGDRVAIMADGEIQCCGSPMFLKRKFGTGYHLRVVKEENFNLNAVTELLQKHVPGTFLETNSEKEASFDLATNVGSSLGRMFEELENTKERLGINSCGVTVTTMEDVFLNVANLSDMKLKAQGKNLLQNGFQFELNDTFSECKGINRSNPLNKLFGLILKRMHYAKRHWSILVSQLILPFLLMCLCLYLIKATSYQYTRTYPPLKLDISDVYGNTKGFYKTDEGDLALSLTEKLKLVFKENKVDYESTNDPNNLIIKFGEKDIYAYLKKFLVGSDVEMDTNEMVNITAWFNGEPYHALPMSLLLMNNAILKTVAGTGSISLTNAPLPYAADFVYDDVSRLTERIMASVFVPLALAFLSATFVLVPIQERTSKSKLLQLMTGIPAAVYWMTMFIWDYFVLIIVCIILIIPFALFSHYAFFTPHSEAIGTSMLLMMLYGWASIPFSYLISFVFKKPNTGFSVIVAVNVITGIAASTTLIMIRLTVRNEIHAVNILMWVFRIFPSFSLSSGFSELFAIAYNNAYCDGIPYDDLQFNCESSSMSPQNPMFKCCKDICGSMCLNQTYPITWNQNGCGRDIMFLFLDGVIYFLLVIFLELNILKLFVRFIKQNLPKFKKVLPTVTEVNFVPDSDVLQEEERIRNIHSTGAADEALIVSHLTKTFKNFYAVDHLTFGIHKEECFGLLGVNGAGKTTTFRMLTGDCYPTEGNAFIQNCNLIADMKEFQSHIGYCPQFDALIDRLTGREMITLFARLRGLSGPSMVRSVNKLISMTDLTQYADKPSMVYSGGNKRKLSIALSLIGAPPLILLDEPTAGVDPVSRRKIWNILAQARNETGAAIILTTHSMEESEALCSRLAIMVNGRFQCLGSIQQLKTKYGQGYTLIIKMKRETQNDFQAVNAIKNYVASNLTNAQLKDDHQGMIQYHIVDPTMTLSYLFKFMDDMKPKYDLEDFLISDTSLEQIFLTFARAQRITT